MSKIEQFKLHLYPELPEEKPTVYLDRIRVGSSAIEILEEITKCFSGIEKFMYIKYDPYHSSGCIDDDDSFIYSELDSYSISADKVNKKNLLSISDNFFKKEKILGIASKVTMKDGSEAHIPMMDFGCSIEEENLAKIEQIMIPYHGFILESGNSYHFWGSQLMTKNKWQGFLDYCDKKNKDSQYFFTEEENLVEENYIAACRSRGTCILRIFNYLNPNTGVLEKDEPKVVRVLK